MEKVVKGRPGGEIDSPCGRSDGGNSFLILGAGRFGKRAIEQIHKRDSYAKIVLVDKDPKALDDVEDPRIVKRVSDGIDLLNDSLAKEAMHHWVIPAIPIHVAFEWIIRRLRKSFKVERIPVPDELDLPNTIVGATGDLYTSYADFFARTTARSLKRSVLPPERKGESRYFSASAS